MFSRAFRMSLCIAFFGGMLFSGNGAAYAQTSPAFAVRGRVTTSIPAKSIRVVAEDPKAKGVSVAEAIADDEGNYELTNLSLRAYRLTAWIDGRKQDSRNFEILCRPGTVMKKSFFYGKNEPSFTFYFPLEDPEVADVNEVQSGVSAGVMKEYAKASEEYANGNLRSAVQRLDIRASECSTSKVDATPMPKPSSAVPAN